MTTKKEIEKLIMMAMLKGFIHAAIMPIVVMLVMLYATESLWGFLSPFAYVALVSWAYYNSKNKDISKIVFFRTLGVVSAILLVFLLLIMS